MACNPQSHAVEKHAGAWKTIKVYTALHGLGTGLQLSQMTVFITLPLAPRKAAQQVP